MTPELAAYEIEMLEHQKLIGECLRGLLLLGRSGPAVDDLSRRWDALEHYRCGGLS